MYKEKALLEMKKVFDDNTHEVTHALAVLGYAEQIMEEEGMPEEKRELISITAILHDIGIPEAIRKYGSAAAPYQEKEGAIIAGKILDDMGYPQKDRVCYIIGHHHTISKVDEQDFEVQWDADLLVNLQGMELRKDREKLKRFIEENFKTKSGKKIATREFLD